MKRDICWPLVITITLVVLFIGSCTLDCVLGKSDGVTARVVSKEYTPPYDTFTPIQHSDGTVSINHMHYSEVYSLVFDDGSDVSVSRACYHRVTNGSPCVITFRVGKWTGIRYGAQVYPQPAMTEK